MQEYTIDLAKPARERWRFGNIATIRRIVQDAEREVLSLYPTWGVRSVEILLDWLLRACAPADYFEELQGLADYTAISPSRLLLLNVSYDLSSHGTPLSGSFGCTGALVETPDAGVVLSRNLDWSFPASIIHETVLHRFVHSGVPGWSALTVGFPGFVGVVSGMNTHGVALALNQAFQPSFPRLAQPMTWVVRDALVASGSAKYARDIVCSTPAMSSGYVFITGKDAKHAALIESRDNNDTIHTVTPRAALTWANHFHRERAPATQEWGDSFARKGTLDKQLTAGRTLKQALSTPPVLNGSTAHQLIFNPSDLSVQIRCPTRAPARWKTFHV